MKLYIKISHKQKEEVLSYLTSLLGLPYITSRLSVYTNTKNNRYFTINFDNENCQVKMCPRDLEEHERYFELKNHNIKNFFQTLSKIGFNKGRIGEIISHNFSDLGSTRISVLSDSFIGDQIQVCSNSEESWSMAKSKKYFDRFKLESTQLGINHTMKPKYVTLVDSLGVLHQKIIDFANKVGLDVRTSNHCLQQKILNHSNDYSYLEKPYKEITKHELISTRSLNNHSLFEPVSIIIPCYNSEQTILKTLYSIESQNLPKELLKQVNVVVVDDGSVIPVSHVIKNAITDFSYNLDIIRLESNKGLSTARNIGFNASFNQNVIFLDSDVLIPSNYLLEVSVRVGLIPNAVFVSFKKNIDPTNLLTSPNNILKGLNVPTDYDDLRVCRYINGTNSLGIYDTSNKSYQSEILSDSDYFKTLGYGRHIGVFDLSAMVVGHNISLRRKIVESVNQFSQKFVGWGLEDAYFGSKVISQGNFVIPITSTGVYHINHEPRSGSQEKKMQEFETNLSIYKNLLLE